MTKMLRHKETGELFVYTTLLATLDVLEPVIEDPIADVIAEMAAGALAAVQDIPEFTPKNSSKEETVDRDMKAAPGYMSNTDKGRKAK